MEHSRSDDSKREGSGESHETDNSRTMEVRSRLSSRASGGPWPASTAADSRRRCFNGQSRLIEVGFRQGGPADADGLSAPERLTANHRPREDGLLLRLQDFRRRKKSTGRETLPTRHVRFLTMKEWAL